MDKNNLPAKIDRYLIKGLLGEGAMGLVLLGFDPKLQREVAIKIVSDSGMALKKGVERFHREARAIAALRHPNIVEIYDYSGAESDLLYLVMERLNGIDLFDLVDRMGNIPEPIVAAIGKEVCSALGQAHRAGVIHRDLKPENVYIDYSGRVVLTDFGIAKAFEEDNCIDASWSTRTEIVGTPGFMSPEQMIGQGLGPYTDFFALGAMLYNLLTRTLPFDGKNPQALYEAIKGRKYKDPRMGQPLITDQMWDVLRSCLEVQPKDRPRNTDELERAFSEMMAIWGVTDANADIRLYIHDPNRYLVESKKRALNEELKRLKVALKDHNQQDIAKSRARIALLDPNNTDASKLSESGVFALPPTHKKDVTAPVPRRTKAEKNNFKWYVYFMALMCGMVLGVGGVIVFDQLFLEKEPAMQVAKNEVPNQAQPQPDSPAPIVPAESAAEPAIAPTSADSQNEASSEAAAEVAAADNAAQNISQKLPLEIQTSKKGFVWVDGKLLGKNISKSKVMISSGSKHTIKAKLGKSKPIVNTFEAPDNGKGRVYINFQKKNISIKWVNNQ